MLGCPEEGSWAWEQVGRYRDSWQDIFPTRRQVSSPVMRQAPHGRAQGSKETQTAETNPGLLQPLWVATAHSGHGCFTSVPRLLQGSSGRPDTMASCTHCRGPVGLEWPSPTPSLGNKSELPVLPIRTHSSLHSPPPASLQPARHSASLVPSLSTPSWPSGPPQTSLGFK